MTLAATEHSARFWRSGECEFFRFECAPMGLELNKVMYDGIMVGTVERSVWQSRQNGRIYDETPESLILRDSGQIFSVKTVQVNQNAGGTFRCIFIDNSTLANIYRDHTEHAMPALDFRSPVIENKPLRKQFSRVHAVVEESDCDLEKSTHTALFLTALVKVAGNTVPHIIEESRKCYVRDVVDYLRGNFSQNITLKELAELTQTNAFVLLRQFKRQTNVTPHEYLHAYRINVARGMIQEGFRLSDVAAACGFSDQSHLTRLFKRMVGVTPGQFLPLMQK